MILRDQQIGGAVVVVVSGDDGARLFQLNSVETNLGSDIFETVCTEIAEEAHFTLAFFRLADRDEIDPAVVVVIDGGYAEGTDPVGFGEFHLLEGLAVIVAPEGESWRTRMRESQIHPTVVVEVENGNSG